MTPQVRERKPVEKTRYRKVSTRMYADEKFMALSPPKPSGQGLWQYLITGPHTTQVPGLFIAGEAGLSEALGWPVAAFRRCWQEIAAQGMAHADWKARLVWLPNSIRHNLPESPNVVTSWKAHLSELPACELRDRALWHIHGVLETVGDTDKGAYAKAFRDVLPAGVAKRAVDVAFPAVKRAVDTSEDLREALEEPTPKPSVKATPNQEQEQDLPPQPPRGLLVDEAIGDRARKFFNRYPRIYEKCRNGAFYRPKEARDFGTVIELVTAHPDLERLCLMVEVFLKRTDIGPKNVPGTINQFAHMAPDCDAKLREHGR